MVVVKRKRPVPLSTWLEEVVRLPAGIAAVPGPLHLHPLKTSSVVTAFTRQVTRMRSTISRVTLGFPPFAHVRKRSPTQGSR